MNIQKNCLHICQLDCEDILYVLQHNDYCRSKKLVSNIEFLMFIYTHNAMSMTESLEKPTTRLVLDQ